MRRGVRMVYIVENNGVYGLTKGQFSPPPTAAARARRASVNSDSPVDLVGMALQLGATYVARGFSGDKAQLVPLIKGAIRHGGAAFIDVISPCVAFNNHAGSTKSYDYVREHNEAVSRIDFIDLAQRDHRRARAGRGDRGAAARRQHAAPAQAARRLRPHRPLRRHGSHAHQRWVRSSLVCSTSTRWRPTCTPRLIPRPHR
jgi:2-oxoglutarate ferredoxin oxidoreductase subunit beta